MRRADLNLPELNRLVEELLFMLPASARTSRRLVGDATFTGLECGPLLAGTINRLGHFSFLKAMWERLRQCGLAARTELTEAMHLILVAIEVVKRRAELGDDAMVDVLDGLRSSEHFPKLIKLIRSLGDKTQATGLMVWILRRAHDKESSQRISFAGLQRVVPGFAEPFDIEAIWRFQRLCARAFERRSSAQAGKAFEQAVTQRPHRNISVRQPLNEVKTTRTIGDTTLAGDHWKYAGQNYKGGENFKVFDLVVCDANNRPLIASCADGSMQYLCSKLEVLCEYGKNVHLFDPAVEDLRFLADRVPALAPLRTMTQADARKEIARHAVLLVHPDSVLPLRAVIVSLPTLDDLLDAFMKLRGLSDRNQALDELLASIQPGIDQL